MRYTIMLQVVGIMTLILLGASAMFAWLQNRPAPESQENETRLALLDNVLSSQG